MGAVGRERVRGKGGKGWDGKRRLETAGYRQGKQVYVKLTTGGLDGKGGQGAGQAGGMHGRLNTGQRGGGERAKMQGGKI